MVSRCGDVMGTLTIEQTVTDLATDPHDPRKNFNAGLAYDAIGQTASAVSFFLRAAEYGYSQYSNETDLIVYTSLIKTSHCFAKQGEREHTVENSLRQAIAYLPARPEAYFFMAQRCERKQDYHMAYLWASIGRTFAEEAMLNPLPADIGYLLYGLDFEKAVASWWVGRKDEGEILFNNLLETYEMQPEYVNSCISNLKMIRG